jgi:hypothetical protein
MVGALSIVRFRTAVKDPMDIVFMFWSIAVGNNYYLYFNNDGKIEFFPVDYDQCFGGWAPFDATTIGIYDWGNHNRELLNFIAPHVPSVLLDMFASCDYPLVEKMFEIAKYRDIYERYLTEFTKPENGLFLYSEHEKMFDKMYRLYGAHLENDTGEGEEMYKSVAVRNYYRAKTLSIIRQLGLNAAEYEVPE